MPSIDENLRSWDKDWGHDGSEWSTAWGSSQTMWRHSILPRIGHYFPTDSLLEIAPGRGRLTQFLLPMCSSYVGIDLAPTCVDACRHRFAGEQHARFATTSGSELQAAEDASIDFAFSWDSLVHVDANVLRGYVAELARCLKPGGSAFLHHSNMQAYASGSDGSQTVENPHWRDPTVSAETVAQACRANGLHLRAQELAQWGVAIHSDCFSVMQRPPDEATPPPATMHFEHPSMVGEMEVARRLSQLYWNT
ncbi:MAG: class I SAM-dependent methyltransferase [Planctomycetota bacterium]